MPTDVGVIPLDTLAAFKNVLRVTSAIRGTRTLAPACPRPQAACLHGVPIERRHG